ncbi:MAG: hypothetical protein WCC66_00860 [Rhizobiaceae bacterium]
MRRIFAFDPGTSALGWAVVEVESGHWTIKACGVRLHALARQRIVQNMKQRLKPEAREKSRQRRRARLRHLQILIAACGLAAPEDGAPWQRQDGGTLRSWQAQSLTHALPGQALARIVFNIHRHRGDQNYGPAGQPIRTYLAALLEFQSRWHGALTDETMRQKIGAAVFFRREAKPAQELPHFGSPLSAMAFAEFRTVWHALAARFGPADEVAFEAPIPALCHSTQAPIVTPDVTRILELAGHAPTQRRLLRAKLYLQQADAQTGLARCALTGENFDVAAAFSAEIEIDHTLPRVRGGKGGRRNLRLGLATANRAKGSGPGPASARASGADKRVSATDADALRNVVRLASAFAKERLSQGEVTMISVGRITALRRRLFETGQSKNRSDLRHHAVDAMLAAILAADDAQAPDGPVLAPPVMRGRIENALKTISLSSRAEHSTKGCMHEATRQGLRRQDSDSSAPLFITSRKPVGSLTKPMLGKIVDSALRQRAAALDPADSQAVKQVFGRTRRVKIMQPGSEAIILRDAAGRFLAAVLSADNHHMDIVQMRDGLWRAFAAARHQRAQPDWRPQWEANRLGGKLVMRLHKGDLVEWQSDTGDREVLIVARISGSSGIVHFSRPFGDTEGAGLVAAAARTMQKRQMRALHADAAGGIRYRRSNCA